MKFTKIVTMTYKYNKEIDHTNPEVISAIKEIMGDHSKVIKLNITIGFMQLSWSDKTQSIHLIYFQPIVEYEALMDNAQQLLL